MAADHPQQDRDAGLSRERIGGRFLTKYDPVVAFRICERIAEGELLTHITRDEGMPHRNTFHRWVVNQPELARAFAAAKELSSYALEEEALEAARGIKNNPETSVKVQAYRTHMEQLRWSAARRNPRVFSERGSIQITVPIQINTPLDMGDGDKTAGAPDHPNIYLIEATVETPVDPEQVTPVEAMQADTGPLVTAKPAGRPRTDREKRRRGPRRNRSLAKTVIHADTKA